MAVAAGLGDLVIHDFADDHFDRLRARVLDVRKDELDASARQPAAARRPGHRRRRRCRRLRRRTWAAPDSDRSRSSPTRTSSSTPCCRVGNLADVGMAVIGAARFARAQCRRRCAASAGASRRQRLSRERSRPAKVVVIAVPDLRWSDLASMPHLSAYAAHVLGRRPVGARRARRVALRGRQPDLRAGNRADAGGATAGCTLSARDARGAARVATRTTATAPTSGRSATRLPQAGSTAAVGPGASLLLADAAGQVARASPPTCATALRSAPASSRWSTPRCTGAGGAAGRSRPRSGWTRELAAQLARGARRRRPRSSPGPATPPTGGPHLHVVLIHGPGWRHVELSSPTTRAQFVQLIDLAPTILARAEPARRPPR